LTGGYVGQNATRPVRVRPGDISLLDLAYPLETRTETSSTLSIVLPRDALTSLIGAKRIVPGSVIDGSTALGRVLRHHLTSVWNAMSEVRADEEQQIANVLLGTLAGAFAGEAVDVRDDQPHAAELYSATLEAICAYIERNLHSDRLTPAHLCARFACSRAKLYRLFDPLGGIAAYIRQARLERCRRELRDPKNRDVSVTEIAMRWGFSSHSHFCRLFRNAFGATPSEVQEQALVLFPPASRAITIPRPALHDWLRQI
jgi:AraC-like DNA-binding protein